MARSRSIRACASSFRIFINTWKRKPYINFFFTESSTKHGSKEAGDSKLESLFKPEKHTKTKLTRKPFQFKQWQAVLKSTINGTMQKLNQKGLW